MLDVVLPLLALFAATVAAGEIIQLLGVGDGEDMSTLLAAQGDLWSVEALEHLEARVGSDLGALLIELGTLVAPGAIIVCGLWQALYRYEEGVQVHAAELDGVLALANAIAA